MASSDHKTECPACGGTKLREKEETWYYTPVYADKVFYSVGLIYCPDCTESFAASGHDEAISKVLREAGKTEVRNILQYFYNVQGFSSSYLERVLRLPGGTLAEWLNEGPSPEGLTLLRFVRHDVGLLKLFTFEE